MKQPKDHVCKKQKYVRNGIINVLINIVVPWTLEDKIEILWCSFQLHPVDSYQVDSVLKEFFETLIAFPIIYNFVEQVSIHRRADPGIRECL
jgi:hypothetical protein